MERSLNDILTDINTLLEADVSFGSQLTSYKLCTQQPKDEKIFPMLNQGDGQGKSIHWDDLEGLTVYHRIVGEIGQDTDPNKGFGKTSLKTRTYPMRAVFIGTRKDLTAAQYEDNENFARGVADVFPAALSGQEIVQVTSLEVGKITVYQTEWPGTKLNQLSLDGIAFWIDYTITSKVCYTPGALNITTPILLKTSAGVNVATLRNTPYSLSAAEENIICGDSASYEVTNSDGSFNITIDEDTELDDISIGHLSYPAAKDLSIGYHIPVNAPTTQYRVGDAKWIEDNYFASIRALTFPVKINLGKTGLTITQNNPFGNTNRFTDTLGGQDYANNLVIDWWTNIIWYRTLQTAATRNDAIDVAAASTYQGIGTWFLPWEELLWTLGITWDGSGSNTVIGYAPFSYSTGQTLWSSTTNPNNSAGGLQLRNNQLDMTEQLAITSTAQYIYCAYNDGIYPA